MGYYAHTLCVVVRVNLSRFPVGTRLVAENIFVSIPTLAPMENLSFLESMEMFMSLTALPPCHLEGVGNRVTDRMVAGGCLREA